MGYTLSYNKKNAWTDNIQIRIPIARVFLTILNKILISIDMVVNTGGYAIMLFGTMVLYIINP